MLTFRALVASPSVIALLLASACGGGSGASGTDGAGGDSTSTNGDGGSGNGSSTSNNTGGGTTSSSSMGTGGSAACHPSKADPTASQCTTSCECQDTLTSNPDWCSSMLQDPGVDACPADCNRCSAGSNQCGYDLPKDETYQPPDTNCKTFVNGDTWYNQSSEEGTVTSAYDENGQYRIGSNAMGPEAWYFNGYKMSGMKFYWNRANAAAMESAEGEITADCMTITMRFYYAGSSTPYSTQIITWNNP